MFDEDVNEAVRLLKRDKSMDVREPVANIQTFPLNNPSGEGEVQEFVGKMRAMIDRRNASAGDSRESLSTWAEDQSERVTIPDEPPVA